MTKEVLTDSLYKSHSEFISNMARLSEQEFLFHKENKWTAGQQLKHIYLSVQPVRLAFTLPNWLLQLIWVRQTEGAEATKNLLQSTNLN